MDIVERLRMGDFGRRTTSGLCGEAADRIADQNIVIERQEAKIEKLREGNERLRAEVNRLQRFGKDKQREVERLREEVAKLTKQGAELARLRLTESPESGH